MRLLKREFRAWLESKPKRAIVGETWYWYDGPISRWASVAIRPRLDGCLRGGTYSRRAGLSEGPRRPLPKWVEDFAIRLCGLSESRITAARALRILDGEE